MRANDVQWFDEWPGKPSASRLDNLADIVKDFLIHVRPAANEELGRFRQARPRIALKHAALAKRFDRKRFSHQRRINRHALVQSYRCLMSLDLASIESFHALLGKLSQSIGAIRGIGELTIYDTALRLGAVLALEPDRVYLHAGTRVGARHLSLDWRRPYLWMRDLPVELRTLQPREVEDFLCIYKKDLATLTRST